MTNFRYRALTQSGEIVSGAISATTADEVARRIEYLGLVPIETISDEGKAALTRFNFSFGQKPRAEDVTIFTRDLALLMRAGARLDDALELLVTDADIGRLRAVIASIRAGVMSGDNFADSLGRHPAVFPPMYIAMARVGEASGTLDQMLEVLAAERSRAETLRRKVSDALRYPAFVLFAAGCVLIFFLMFVLPQFGSVLRDFGAKLDPTVLFFLAISDFLRDNKDVIALTVIGGVAVAWMLLRRPAVKIAMIGRLASLPLIRQIAEYHRTALFCRNLGVLLGGGVALTTTLRILADMMASTGNPEIWTKIVEHVRHGGKLSDALTNMAALPGMAVRMLRLGEETGQLPLLSGRVAEFYEAKLQRSLDRVVGIVGPASIVIISIVVGGLIVSVMTSLMSISQIVG